jgi:hypothetical protein
MGRAAYALRSISAQLFSASPRSESKCHAAASKSAESADFPHGFAENEDRWTIPSAATAQFAGRECRESARKCAQ